MRADPIFQLLRSRSLGKGVVGSAQHGDEDLRGGDFAGGGIDNIHRRAAIIDKHLLARAVGLPHREAQTLLPLFIANAKLGVAVSLRPMLRHIFFP